MDKLNPILNITKMNTNYFFMNYWKIPEYMLMGVKIMFINGYSQINDEFFLSDEIYFCNDYNESIELYPHFDMDIKTLFNHGKQNGLNKNNYVFCFCDEIMYLMDNNNVFVYNYDLQTINHYENINIENYLINKFNCNNRKIINILLNNPDVKSKSN